MRKPTFRGLLFFIISFITLAAHAQTVPVPRLFQYNYLLYNPGYAGANEDRELSLTAGTPNVSYKYPVVGAFGYYQGRVSENVGAGTQILYSQNNGYYRFHMGFTGNQSARFGDNGRIALGVQIGVKHLAVDYERVSQISGDTTLPFGSDNDFRADGNIGIWINTQKLFAGVSVMNVLSPKYEFIGSADFQDKPQIALTGGYHFGKNSHLELTPSFLFTKTVQDTLETLDINTTALIGQLLIVGVTYRGFNGEKIPWVGMAGVQLSDHFQVVASFDVPLDTPRQFYRFNAEGVARILF